MNLISTGSISLENTFNRAYIYSSTSFYPRDTVPLEPSSKKLKL